MIKQDFILVESLLETVFGINFLNYVIAVCVWND